MEQQNQSQDRWRKGYTTGSAATGAAKAAVKLLFTQQQVSKVRIDTPAGVELELEIAAAKLSGEYAQASVIKDGGDDPDVTDGLEIMVRARKLTAGIKLIGGLGVGEVTKPGLPVEVGQPAINPVPRQMIKEEVKKILPSNSGVELTVEVPEGIETAQQTLNPKLGIKGGISILGTTGIVEPMSEQAYKDSLVLSIDQALAVGKRKLAFVFGNYGKREAKQLGFSEDEIVRMSNFVGFMLEYASKKEVEKVTLVGHVGKLVKVAAGIFNTHSEVADGRLETIAAYTATLVEDRKLINQILASNTAEEAVKLVQAAGCSEVFDLLAKQVVVKATEYIEGNFNLTAVLFTLEVGVIGQYGNLQER
ncbi:MAG: cobalt-precorrin-5B (C(1))-methyltransferase CbiD [Bacillota bacterium]